MQPHSTLCPTYGITHLEGDLHSGISRTALILILPPRGIHVKVGEMEEPQSKDIFLSPPPLIFCLFFSSVRDLFRVLSYKIKQNYKVNLLGGKKKSNKTPRPPYNTFQPQIEMAERSSLFYLSVTSSVSLSSLSRSLSPPLLSPEAAREEEHLSLS